MGGSLQLAVKPGVGPSIRDCNRCGEFAAPIPPHTHTSEMVIAPAVDRFSAFHALWDQL